MGSCRCCGHDPVKERTTYRFMSWLIAGMLLAVLVTFIPGVPPAWFLGFGIGMIWVTIPFDWSADRWWQLNRSAGRKVHMSDGSTVAEGRLPEPHPGRYRAESGGAPRQPDGGDA